jgi:hypothetical protein
VAKRDITTNQLGLSRRAYEKHLDVRTEEDNSDTKAIERITTLISRREPHVQAVLIQNVMNIVRYRIEEMAREAKSQASHVQVRATEAWKAATKAEDAVEAIRAVK